MESVIYDIGSNEGQDIPYYLLKADRVVAIEPNPQLCALIAERHGEAIASGRLVIVNGAVMTEADYRGPETPFFLHRSEHWLSTLVPPGGASRADYEQVTVRTTTLAELVAAHGVPLYAKIDIEGYDAQIVREFFRLGILPRYLSAEIHTREAVRLLLGRPEYTGFKLVEGAHVARDYGAATIDAGGAPVAYSFPGHSAGPMGNDIHGPWFDRASMRPLVRAKGLGWNDLHASRSDAGVPQEVVVPLRAWARDLKRMVRRRQALW